MHNKSCLLTHKAIRSDADWSFSVYHSFESKASNKPHCLYNDYEGGSFNWLYFSYVTISTTTTFLLIKNGNNGGNVQKLITLPSNYKKMTHTVLTYNSTTREFSLYVNSQFIETFADPTPQDFGLLSNDYYLLRSRATGDNQVHGRQ